jgi:cation diffusion facilitator family transporter
MDAFPASETQEKRRAALLSVGSAVLLVSLKAFLVVRTGSLGVLSEALHSGLDLVAAVITFLSLRVSDRPADERHPYGHGKFENFSAFVETGLLLLTALYIIYEAFDRLFFHSVHIQPSLTAIFVLLGALVIDITRARKLSQVAEKYSSEALEADALHFSTDVWSTIVVIAGIGLVWAGEKWNMPWLAYADALAGLAVAGVILWVGSRLGRRTLDALLDAGSRRAAGRNHRRGQKNGRSAFRAARATAPRGQSLFCGRHGQRSAHRQPRAGSCLERRDRKARRRNCAFRRRGSCRAARTARRTVL